MRILNEHTDVAGFFEKIPGASERILMLDYDGTLAPFHPRPHMAYPYPEVTRALDHLMRDGRTRVVIISGRRAEEIMPLLRLARQPEIWGAHGWERLSPEGELSVREISAREVELLDSAFEAARNALEFGARLERKTASIALHWRGLALIKRLKTQAWISAVWQPMAGVDGLELQSFAGGLEILVRGHRKGFAVRQVLERAEEGSAIAYLGDDITDEEAFMEVRDRGLAVLVRDRLRETNANLWIRPPHELKSFISHWDRVHA
ncbi:MAG: trehalose-phosphatase [Betaproteobacteria bacterium]|nr:trehalose-phosphatase [Betaproteobacteria bacterium]